ncbi:MAG: hypothetical protein RLZZ387_1958 [Chloroflexota bacterium]|jgi:serine/threonine protein kinase
MTRDNMTSATPPPTPVLQGRYRIEERLGAGRLAVVYRAHDERLQRQVLVHMFRRDLMDQEPLRQRFVGEAQSSARRAHASLLDVFDTGEVGGRPYMITEYVAGRTLREIGALSLEEALLYFRQIVGAVAACQAAGVPHPPISSANVILVGEGHVELLENWCTSPAERAVELAAYRPPERASGTTSGPTGAVYALGLLLVEMLIGRRVFDGTDPRAIAERHLTAEVPSLTQVQPLMYAPSLDRLLRLATARDPSRRPADAAALGQALDELRRTYAGDTQPLAAPPPRSRPQPAAPPSPAPLPASSPAPAEEQRPAAPRVVPVQPDPSRRRSLTGLTVMVVLFLAVSCAAYSFASGAAGQISAGASAISLPDWLTGVVGGEGEVLVVSIGDIEGLNLRDRPGLQSNVIGLLPNGARVRKLGGPETADGVSWVRVRAEVDGRATEGWVSATFVRPE